MAWAEDRALLRSNPSADPGAKTEGRAVCHAAAAQPSTLRDWHQSDKPSRQDAAISPAGCLPRFANARRQEFQFPLNQYTWAASAILKRRRRRSACFTATANRSRTAWGSGMPSSGSVWAGMVLFILGPSSNLSLPILYGVAWANRGQTAGFLHSFSEKMEEGHSSILGLARSIVPSCLARPFFLIRGLARGWRIARKTD